MAGLASHGCGPNGSTTSLVLACRMLRAVQNPCRHIIVLPSTGLPPPWQFVCAESNTRIQSLTSRCAQLSPRWVCCVSNIISYAQRATVRIHLHNQISCSLDGSVTSLACRMRRAIHLWHVIRAELFIPMLTRARHGGSRAALDGSPTSLACRMRRAILSRAHSWQGTVASGPRVRVPGHRASCPSQAHSWRGTVASGPRVRIPSPLRNRQYEGCCPRRNTTHGGRIPLHTRSPSGRGLIAAHSYHSCIITGRTEALHRAEHRPWSWALSFTH